MVTFLMAGIEFACSALGLGAFTIAVSSVTKFRVCCDGSALACTGTMRGPPSNGGWDVGQGVAESTFLDLFARNDPLRSAAKRPSQMPRLSASFLACILAGVVLYVMQSFAVPAAVTQFLRYDLERGVMLGLPLDAFGRPPEDLVATIQPVINRFTSTRLSDTFAVPIAQVHNASGSYVCVEVADTNVVLIGLATGQLQRHARSAEAGRRRSVWLVHDSQKLEHHRVRHRVLGLRCVDCVAVGLIGVSLCVAGTSTPP